MTHTEQDRTVLPAHEERDSHGKALSLNLEGSIYGTFAEIGAGQEVARWFLSVGAASGSVAETISAYDKNVSDEIYGAGTRYVSKERLVAMLDREYTVLLRRLNAIRGKGTRFFAFADTVATRSYQGNNQQHGWLGIRFQAEPGSEPSEILLHINLLDPAAQLQQQAIGILGVNLVYATFQQRTSTEHFLAGLFDGLSIERIEVDVLELRGPAFSGQDSGEWCLKLLGRNMAHAIVFDSERDVVESASLLRKRPLLVMRGTFTNPELFEPDLFRHAGAQLSAEGATSERPPLNLLEMTVRHVSRAGSLSPIEMLARIRRLTMRSPVMASNFPETYLLSRYLRRHSTEPVRFVLSIAAVAKVMHEQFYEDLPGSLLEGLGRLFSTNVKLYVAPMPKAAFLAALRDMPNSVALKESDRGLVSLDDLMPAAPGLHLFDYLRASGRIVALAH